MTDAEHIRHALLARAPALGDAEPDWADVLRRLEQPPHGGEPAPAPAAAPARSRNRRPIDLQAGGQVALGFGG